MLFAQQAYKCTLKGPMNGLYVLAHARLLSMGGPPEFNTVQKIKFPEINYILNYDISL